MSLKKIKLFLDEILFNFHQMNLAGDSMRMLLWKVMHGQKN